jgi:ribosome-binding protein aMBF1 (putative translation factor)
MLQQHTFSEDRVAGLEPTTGSPRGLFRLIQVDVDRFQAHVASLPTLDDLIQESRAQDPAFDAHYAAAEEQLYADALAEVSAGTLSRVTAERLRLGLTQAELADRAGMLQPNVSRLERSGAPISVVTARKLARALGLDDYKVLLP